mgnify:CR=1 FL=1
MVGLDAFLRGVQEIKAEAPTYRLGGDGSDGTCDCIGLIIGAIRRAGGKWTGTHGSNYAARFAVGGMMRNVDAAELEPGWIVFKAYGPLDAGYDLPDKYRVGGASYTGDVMDYYHVGVVTSIDPLNITHCTKGGGVDGVTVDTRQGDWRYAALCTMVDYSDSDRGGEDMEERRAVVVSGDGNPVKLRPTPSTDKPYLAKVPVGTQVEVMQDAQGWAQVRLPSGQVGYMMSQFLAFEDEDNGSGGGEYSDFKKSVIDQLESIHSKLDAVLDAVTNG